MRAMSDLLDQLGIKDRAGVELFIERLIAMLDAIDGDPDLEDGNDAEPEETDQNGDEGDYSMSEDAATAAQLCCLPICTFPGGQGL